MGGSRLVRKQRLQTILFPNGLTYTGEQFGTAGSCPFFETWDTSEALEGELASPTGFANMWKRKLAGIMRRTARSRRCRTAVAP